MKYQFFLKILAINICLASTLIAMDETDNPNNANDSNMITEDIQSKNIEITTRTKSDTASISSYYINSADSTPTQSHSADELSNLKTYNLDDLTSTKENNINNNNVDTTPCPPQSNTSSKSGYRLKSDTYTSLSINNLQEQNSEIPQKESQSMPDPVSFITDDSIIENNSKSPPATPTTPDLEAPLAVQVAKEIKKTEERLNYLKNIKQTFTVQSSEVEHRYLCKNIQQISSKILSSYKKNRLKDLFQSLELDKLGIIFENATLVVLMRHGRTVEASKQGDDVINNGKAGIEFSANYPYTGQLNELNIFATPMFHSNETRAHDTALLIAIKEENLARESKLEELQFGESSTKDREQLLQNKILEVRYNMKAINSIRQKGIDVASTLQSVASQMESEDNNKSGLCVTHNSSLLCFYFSSWVDTHISTSSSLLDKHQEDIDAFFQEEISKVENINTLSSFITIVDKSKSNYVLLHNDPMEVENLITCMPTVKTAFREFIEEKLKKN